MTVAEVDALLYLPGHDRASVARALRMPALSPGWQDPSTPCWPPDGAPPATPGSARRADRRRVVGFRPAAGRRRGPRERDGRLAPARRRGRLAVAGGAAGAVRRAAPRPRRPAAAASRSYSLSGAPGSPDYRVSVKREPTVWSAGSSTRACAPARSWRWRAPRGRFTLEPATHRCSCCPPASAPPRCCRCCTRWSDAGSHARGLVAARRAQQQASTRSPPRCAPCSPGCPTPRPTSVTARRCHRPAGRGLHRPRPAGGRLRRHPGGADRSGRLHLRTARLHGGHEGRTDPTRG